MPSFTLIETTIYTALLSLLMTGVVVSINTLYQSTEQTQARASTFEQTLFREDASSTQPSVTSFLP